MVAIEFRVGHSRIYYLNGQAILLYDDLAEATPIWEPIIARAEKWGVTKYETNRIAAQARIAIIAYYSCIIDKEGKIEINILP